MNRFREPYGIVNAWRNPERILVNFHGIVHMRSIFSNDFIRLILKTLPLEDGTVAMHCPFGISMKRVASIRGS